MTDAVKFVFENLLKFAPSNAMWGWIVHAFLLLAILLFALYFFLVGASKFLEAVAKAFDAYINSGLPFPVDPKHRIQVRRRSQFCVALDADLAYLAKAENWNDQYFTDLEAEVEMEGGYYRSRVNRWFRRKSNGLRRVPSLIEAIASSAERTILLVGEPGSGKSVALRHLAKQLANRARRSKDPTAVIPLYINLRELDRIPFVDPDADYVKQFVLDNIRRGDADTTAYVRENWDDYRDRGIWFFLFDSFDEIPDVLHSAAGSSAVRTYEAAIRQFLDGMGSCRGVLASREFKGPEGLPWQKFRIMPLSETRQNELIENSFLEPTQMDIVRQYLATHRRNSFATNPLFLSLLCRYVKEENKSLANDHNLIARHVERLTQREQDYIVRKYGLASEEMLTGAMQVAAAFARDESLNLAPTQAEISVAMQNSNFVGQRLDDLLAALIDVKVGRADVPHARPGDRRFTFSHRRYQEALFVRYLALHPSYATPRALITNGRLREYAVTLLQTQEFSIIEPLLRSAAEFLDRRASEQSPIPISSDFGIDANPPFGYFDWKSEPVVPVIALLQEGLARRLEESPSWLADALANFLNKRWSGGDQYDRLMVIELGGLLPQPLLREYLSYAFGPGTALMESIAFDHAVFLTETSKPFGRTIRNRLTNEILNSRGGSERLRLEALAARLPTSIGAAYVVRRCRTLRTLLLPLLVVSKTVLTRVAPVFFRSQRNMVRRIPDPIEPALLFACYGFLWLAGQAVAVTIDREMLPRPLYFLDLAVTLLYAFFVSTVLYLFVMRASGSPLGLRHLATAVTTVLQQPSKVSWQPLTAVVVSVIGTIIAVRYGITEYLTAIMIALIIVVLVVAGAALLRRRFVTRKQMERLRALRQSGKSDIEIVAAAASPSELVTWLDRDEDLLSGDSVLLRSLSRVLIAAQSEAAPFVASFAPSLLTHELLESRIIALNREIEHRLMPILRHGIDDAD